MDVFQEECVGSIIHKCNVWQGQYQVLMMQNSTQGAALGKALVLMDYAEGTVHLAVVYRIFS
eukprot:6244928-Ditylum_brightwellii.AAC.1